MLENRKYGLLIFIAIGVAMVSTAFNRGRMDNELVGVWKLESTQTNGQPMRRERQLWVFRRNMLTIVDDDGPQQIPIRVNPSSSPKHIDTENLFQGAGIYKIEGDKLHLAQAMITLPRPTTFESQSGDMHSVTELRRMLVAVDASDAELAAALVSEFGAAPMYPERMQFDDDAEEFVANLMGNIYNKNPDDLSEKQAVIYHVSWLMTEVNNGGFHQYFFNSTGRDAVETAKLLRKIGADQTAGLVEEGCQLFPKGTPAQDYKQRRNQLKSFSLDQLETLRDLENRFYSRREDLNVLLQKYWESGP
jgi:uncharacterized protein (TIGR03067 family)